MTTAPRVREIFRKTEWVRVLPDHPDITLLGPWEARGDAAMGDHVVGRGPDATAVFRARGLTRALALVMHHPWAGMVVATGHLRPCAAVDLYAPWRTFEPWGVHRSDAPEDVTLTLRVVGRHPLSGGEEMSFGGFFIRADESPYAPDDPLVERFTPEDQDDEAFAALQQSMVDEWLAGIVARGQTVEEVTAQRLRAYSARIAEALVYIPRGGAMLDIGAGHVFEEVLRDLILAKDVEYWIRDIDPRVVEGNRHKFVAAGLDPSRVGEGENLGLPHPDASFDLVFASHCFEHSRDLPATFADAHRVLRPGGHLFFAVPFGWDPTKEHMYALSVEGWTGVATDAGFEVVNTHIGCVYPEYGHDLAVVARRP